MRQVAIVGAGCAGAAAAYALRETASDVTLFEKSRGYGRAATRRRDGRFYDYGANYVKSTSDEVARLLTEVLPADGLVDIEEPVWTFDHEGTIEPGRDADEHKWSYTEGLSQVVKRLLDAAGVRDAVSYETRVERIERVDDGGTGRWRLYSTDDEDLGTFDTVLLTPPAPQTAQLLAASSWSAPDDLLAELHRAVDQVEFRPIYSVLLGYDFRLSSRWYGLVNTDRAHDIGWLSREELKPGHVPDGESLLVAQMAPDWSAERYDDDPEGVVDDVALLVARLLDDERLATPGWTDHQGWRYALPDDGLAGGVTSDAEDHGLFLAGDWVAGEGRVHAAIESGLRVGERIAGHW